MPLNGQKNFNVNIDEQLSDEFSAQIEQRGYTKYRAIEGALRGFMSLSPDEQVRLISANFKPEKPTVEEPKPKTLREVLRNIVESTKQAGQAPSTVIQISPTDKKLWSELQRLLGPEPKQKKKTKKA